MSLKEVEGSGKGAVLKENLLKKKIKKLINEDIVLRDSTCYEHCVCR